MKKLTQNKLLSSLKFLLLIGMLLGVFLLYEHFNPNPSTLCNLGEGLDCGVVNKSPYANVDGIFYLMTFHFGWNTFYINISNSSVFWDVLTANAFLGFLTLLFLFLLTLRIQKGLWWIKKEKTISWIRGILIFSVFYGFLLFLIQHYVLKTYCIYCLGLDVSMILSLVLSYRLSYSRKKKK